MKTCPRCGNEWEPRRPNPKKCPACQNPCVPYKRRKPMVLKARSEGLTTMAMQDGDIMLSGVTDSELPAIIVDIPNESAIIPPDVEDDDFAERKAKAEELFRMLGGS